MAIKILLQTTIVPTVDDWSIARFRRLTDFLSEQTDAAGKPRARDCAAAAATNSVEATKTPTTPRRSRSAMSCTLHDVHDPQSASASMTTSQRVAISCRRSTGAGLVNVGLR